MTRLDLDRAIDSIEMLAKAALREMDLGKLESVKTDLEVIRKCVEDVKRFVKEELNAGN